MSSLRSAKISRSGRKSVLSSDSCSDRHFIIVSYVYLGQRLVLQLRQGISLLNDTACCQVERPPRRIDGILSGFSNPNTSGLWEVRETIGHPVFDALSDRFPILLADSHFEVNTWNLIVMKLYFQSGGDKARAEI